MGRSRFYNLTEALQHPDEVRSLTLYRRGLTTIPPEVFLLPHLEELDLSGNSLREVDARIITLRSLRRINLRNNRLDMLPAASGWPEFLTHLNVAHNQLAALPVLPAGLEYLDISGNRLNPKATERITGPELRSLHLRAINLSRIPPEWQRLQKLQELQLGENQLARLPQATNWWPSLRILGLADNRLRSWSDFWAGRSLLERLDLSGNRLRDLPAAWPGWPQLRVLRLAGNRITELPGAGWEHLVWLRQLDLQNNKLTFLPEDIVRAERLQELLLAGNRMNYLPAELGRLRHLRTLEVDRNPLEELPHSLVHCPLQRISMRGTAMKQPPALLLEIDPLTDLEGIRGRKRLLKFVAYCRNTGVESAFRAFLFRAYHDPKQVDVPVSAASLRQGLRLQLPSLHRTLWKAYRRKVSLPAISGGTAIFVPPGTRISRRDGQAAGLRMVSDPEAARIWLGQGRIPPVPAEVVLLSPDELADMLDTRSPARPAPPPAWQQLAKYPTDGNLQLLASLLQRRNVSPEDLARLLALWIRADAGPGRNALRRFLISELGDRLPREPVRDAEAIRSWLADTELDAEVVWRYVVGGG